MTPPSTKTMSESDVVAMIEAYSPSFKGLYGLYIYHSPHQPPSFFGIDPFTDYIFATGRGDGYVLSQNIIQNDLCEKLGLVPIGRALGASICQENVGEFFIAGRNRYL